MTRLGAAITTLGMLRGAVLAAEDDLIAGAGALDDLDAAAAAGERVAAKAALADVQVTTPKATAALTVLTNRIAAYRQGLTDLAAAAEQVPALDRGQRGLLNAVGTTGAAEAAAASGLGTAGKSAWAAYMRLATAARTWLDRATAGWYRDKRESANAYAVLVADVRAPLNRARAALQRSDVTRRSAGTRVSTALREADAALAPLRSPG